MNKETYDSCSKIYPNFKDEFVQEVPISEIELDEHNSQIRQKGHVVAKVPSMKESIIQQGQIVPITTRNLPNGRHQLIDGITRFLARKELGHKYILVSDWFDRTNKKANANEWYDHQCSQNDHLVSTTNSADDIAYQIQKRIKSYALDDIVGHKYMEDPESYLDVAAEYLKSVVYKNSGLNKLKLKNMIVQSLDGVIATKYEAYTKATAMEKIMALNPHGWTTSKSKVKESIGEICNNACYYLAASRSQLTTNALANVAWKKIDNPNVNMYVVCYIGKLAGKNDEKMLAARQKYIEDYKKINDVYDIFSGLYFMPQFKTGDNKENMYHMIKEQ